MQERAFREAGQTDWWDGAGLDPVPDSEPVRGPEAFTGWDAGRRDPKTVAEAVQALAHRVVDPVAPDSDAGVYSAIAPGALAPRAVRPLGAGAVRIPWLVDAPRSAGLTVVAVPGCFGRGHGGFRALEVVMGHHTATPESAPGDYPSLRVVRDGRTGLAGPLCNYGLGRNGTVYAVADGVAYHAGASAYAGFYDLNDEAVGIEAEDSGDGVWTPAMLDAYPRLVDAVLRYINRGVDRYVSHRDAATPRGRKPDPAGLTDAWMRGRVTALRAGAVKPAPGGTEHVVAAGDTVWAISRRYGITPVQLRTWNGLGSDLLRVGQRLRVVDARVPAPVPPPSGPAAGGRILRLTSPYMTGEDVRVVQRVLRAWYGLPWAFVDGAYGPDTAAQVRRAQQGTPPQPRMAATGEVDGVLRRKLGIAA